MMGGKRGGYESGGGTFCRPLRRCKRASQEGAAPGTRVLREPMRSLASTGHPTLRPEATADVTRSREKSDYSGRKEELPNLLLEPIAGSNSEEEPQLLYVNDRAHQGPDVASNMTF